MEIEIELRKVTAFQVTCVCVHVCENECVYALCVCIYVCIHVCIMCVWLCMYMYYYMCEGGRGTIFDILV